MQGKKQYPERLVTYHDLKATPGWAGTAVPPESHKFNHSKGYLLFTHPRPLLCICIICSKPGGILSRNSPRKEVMPPEVFLVFVLKSGTGEPSRKHTERVKRTDSSVCRKGRGTGGQRCEELIFSILDPFMRFSVRVEVVVER